MVSYLNCFNDIKLALLKKNRYTYIQINRKNTIILDLLIKYSIIYGYRIVCVNSINIYCVYVNLRIGYYNLKNLHKISNPRYIKYKDLCKLQNKNTSSKYILSTSKGLIELKDSIFLKHGGVLLFKIY